MNREIKFRGKDIETNEWRYGYLQHNYNKEYSRILSPLSIDTFYFPIQEFCVDGNTIGQYTGLKDKNGAEIYEGDIFKVINIIGEEFLCIVKWNTMVGAWCLMFKGESLEGIKALGLWLSDCTFEFEVIGNIHDNMDLLED